MGDDRVYGLVRFAGRPRAGVTEVVVVFGSTIEADRFARAQGLADHEYAVGPLRFFVEELPVLAQTSPNPPMGSRIHLDAPSQGRGDRGGAP